MVMARLLCSEKSAADFRLLVAETHRDKGLLAVVRGTTVIAVVRGAAILVVVRVLLNISVWR